MTIPEHSPRNRRMSLAEAREMASLMTPIPSFSDEEIERRAHNDPDAPLATDAQLAGARRVSRPPDGP